MRLSTMLVFLLLTSCLSCRKGVLSECAGNCTDLIIAGKVVNGSEQRGVGQLMVTASLHRLGLCFACRTLKIIEGKTDNDGTFRLVKSFDTTLLQDHYIRVSVALPEGVLLNASPTGPGLTSKEDKYDSRTSNRNNLQGISDIHFTFFNPAPLTLQLHRRSNVVPSRGGPSVSVKFGESWTAWGIDPRPSNIDTSLTWITASNVFSTIEILNWSSDSTVEKITDSIFCLPGRNNLAELYY